MSSEIEQANAFKHAFDTFIEQYVSMSNEQNLGLKTYFDREWPSPCISLNGTSIEDGEILNWLPTKRDDLQEQARPLANIEKALEINIPLSLHFLFCRYFSHDLNAVATQGNLTLLQVWNEEDYERLQKNIIAHVLMKRRLKQADTIFFALTDEEDFVLSILLSSGAVVLEKVGKEPEREIALNLTDFFRSLRPRPQLVAL